MMNAKIWMFALAVPILAGLGVRRGLPSNGLSPQDRQAIVNVALDYVDGFYEADTVRMARALHPDLAKRDIARDQQSGKQYVRNMTARQLIDVTASGAGARMAKNDGRRSDVTILDTFGDIASVRVDASTWVDYLHVGKVNGEWKLINVLWGWRPGRP
jgi:hypothetical protein